MKVSQNLPPSSMVILSGWVCSDELTARQPIAAA